jgi:hypothetical protein
MEFSLVSHYYKSDQSKRMAWAWHVGFMEEKSNSYRVW